MGDTNRQQQRLEKGVVTFDKMADRKSRSQMSQAVLFTIVGVADQLHRVFA